MDEYIKREAALSASKIVYIECIEIDGDGYEEGNADEIPVVFKRDIEAIPAADVAPLVHGKWEITDAYPHNVHCSVCHKLFAQTRWEVWQDGNLPRKYCPNCGAKMDLEN